MQENIEKNYHLLLSEHLSLQRNVASLLSSWIQKSPALPSKDQRTVCGQVCRMNMKVTAATFVDVSVVHENFRMKFNTAVKQ